MLVRLIATYYDATKAIEIMPAPEWLTVGTCAGSFSMREAGTFLNNQQ